ncbi:hypothetical protein LCGC14_0472250 [marine sediment metagenome]|uniref:Uncharacterized protein n=1 Tax=marine sediment metagenome TaxID=412755 RepID=A0A0F9VKU4_9ZZZZ
MVMRADGKDEIRFKDRLVTFEELDDEVTKRGLEEARAIPQEEIDATIRKLGHGDRLDQVREGGSVTRHFLTMLLCVSLGVVAQVAVWAVDVYGREHDAPVIGEAPFDSPIPFIGRFREVFAGPDDPFPGEDVREYCATMSSAYSTILKRRHAGIPIGMVRKWLAESLALGGDKVEIVRALEQTDEAYSGDGFNDTQVWFARGQACMDSRLEGTWYTYDWQGDPNYPKSFDPRTQERLPQPKRTTI